MSRHRKRHNRSRHAKPQLESERRWLTWGNVWRMLLPVRACFWGRNWFRWANSKFPKPEEGESSTGPILQTVLIVGVYFIAYAFYGSQQVVDIPTLFNNFIAGFSPVALVNLSIFIIGLFVAYAYLLRVSSQQLWAPLACIAMPLGMAIASFLFLYIRWRAVGDPITNGDILIRLGAYWVMFASLIGFVYILYRAIKARLNAYLMHPVLTPLIELTLAVKAMAIALQGQATVLTLPHVSSRLLVVALPAVMVIYYLNQTFTAHREFLAKHNNTTTRQLAWCLRQFRAVGPFVGFWRTSSTATFRLGVAITLLFVATIFFPASFSSTDVLDESQIQHAMEAGKSH
jgi:hypothetical protein